MINDSLFTQKSDDYATPSFIYDQAGDFSHA